MVRCRTLLATALVAASVLGYGAVVDPSVRYQTWEGWGTSLAWWAHRVGSLSPKIREDILQQAIGRLRLTIGRYNIGGGDAPGHGHMEPRAAIPGFIWADGTWDWGADPSQRRILLESRRHGMQKFEAFSNSPPWFMTRSGCAAGNTDGSPNLKLDQFDEFASYLAEVVKFYRNTHGITFETLAPMNEPAADWWKANGRQEGCGVAPGNEQSNLVLQTSLALKSRSLPTKVSASDESVNDWAVSGWDKLSQAAKNEVVRLNTHCYGGVSQLNVFHRATRDRKRLWMSEYGDGDATGMSTARQIVRDLRLMKPTAWIYWQVVEQVGYGWGMLELDLNGLGKTITINRKYYAFGNFTRFIRPGAQFVAIDKADSVASIHNGQLTIVTVSDTDRWEDYDLSKFAELGAEVEVYRTSPSHNLAVLPKIEVTNKAFRSWLPKDSVTTFVVKATAPASHLSGFYRLKNVRSTNALEVPNGSWDQGTFLTANAWTGAYRQHWTFDQPAAGFLKIRNRESGQFAATWNDHWAIPTLQWGDNGDTTAHWRLDDLGNGRARLVNRKRLATDPNQYALNENPNRGNGWPDVVAYPDYGGTEMQWLIEKADELYPAASLAYSPTLEIRR